MPTDSQSFGRLFQSPSLEALQENLSKNVLWSSRGAYWVQDFSEESYTVSLRHSYYVEDRGRVRQVTRAFPATIHRSVKKSNIGWETYAPSPTEVDRAYERAKNNENKAFEKACVVSFAPLVAMVDIVGSQLNKFRLAFTSHLERSKPLYAGKQIGTSYIQFLSANGIIKESVGGGYYLSSAAVKYLENHDKNFPMHISDIHGVQANAFLSMCLTNPNSLASVMNIRSPVTYFRILQSLFHHQSSTSLLVSREEKPSEHPASLSALRKSHERFGWGKQDAENLRNRLSYLEEVGGVCQVGDDEYRIEDEWYNVAWDRFSRIRAAL